MLLPVSPHGPSTPTASVAAPESVASAASYYPVLPAGSPRIVPVRTPPRSIPAPIPAPITVSARQKDFVLPASSRRDGRLSHPLAACRAPGAGTRLTALHPQKQRPPAQGRGGPFLTVWGSGAVPLPGAQLGLPQNVPEGHGPEAPGPVSGSRFPSTPASRVPPPANTWCLGGGFLQVALPTQTLSRRGQG